MLIAQQTTKRASAALNSPGVSSGLVQRKCSCAGAGGECAECKKKVLQRREAAGSDPAAIPPIVGEALRSDGAALDPQTRAFFEPRGLTE